MSLLEQVLTPENLAGYVYRTALGKERILSDRDGRLAFNHRRSSNRQVRRCERDAPEFIG